ncbi:acetolactate synthase [Actinomycetota bacterium]|nr:acetolactate synthase [Actinomycetota bacterium]
MKVSEYVVEKLKLEGVTDVFGIPGGVVLDFLDAINQADGITSHLSYNEQSSAFEAIGYYRTSGKLGVAYCTKGPGIANMVQGIAYAYQESFPVLFVTAHDFENVEGVRHTAIQGLDIVPVVSSITKYVQCVNTVSELVTSLDQAILAMRSGRPGPAVLDFSKSLLGSEMPQSLLVNSDVELSVDSFNTSNIKGFKPKVMPTFTEQLIPLLIAKKPLIIIGEGVRCSETVKELEVLVEKLKIPVVSSRSSIDIIPGSQFYLGNVGSNGTRVANYAASEADVVLSLGNRLAYPRNSESFSGFNNKKLIRVDVDLSELELVEPASVDEIDVNQSLLDWFNGANKWLEHQQLENQASSGWTKFLQDKKIELMKEDYFYPMSICAKFIENFPKHVITSDVGINGHCLSRAYSKTGTQRLLLENTWGSLGQSIPMAIGAHYGELCNNQKTEGVIAFTGDEGLLFNLGELEFIKRENLPISVVLINNRSCQMISDQQKTRFGRAVDTTLDSGYSHPDFEVLAKLFGFKYCKIDEDFAQSDVDNTMQSVSKNRTFIEVFASDDIKLTPKLGRGELPYC